MVSLSIKFITDAVILIVNFAIPSLFGSNPFPESTSHFCLRYELLCSMQNSILHRMVSLSIKFTTDAVILIVNFGIPSLFGSNTFPDSLSDFSLRYELLC